MRDRIRIGVIGASPTKGWARQSHLPALQALPEFELAAVCTTRLETAEESAARFGASAAFDDYRKMLDQADLDAVVVSVRAFLHHRPTIDVLEAGKHVFTEWPLGANLHEAEEMAAVARRQGVRTMVGLQERKIPLFLRLKELVDEGYLGEVLTCRVDWSGDGNLSGWDSTNTWRADARSGANALTVGFGHTIDPVCVCLGEFSEVAATVTTQSNQWVESDTGRTVEVTSPDNVLVTGTLESGVAVSASSCYLPWHGSGYRLEMYGTEGTVAINRPMHSLDRRVILGGRAEAADLEELEVPDRLTSVPDSVPAGNARDVAGLLRLFGESITTGRSVDPTFDDAVSRHRLLDAIVRASDSGQRQKLNTFKVENL